MQFMISELLKIEHDDLHKEFAKAAKAGGGLHRGGGPSRGATARAAEAPCRGRLNPDLTVVLAMTDRHGIKLPRMLAEHEAAVAVLDRLVEVASEDASRKSPVLANS